MSCYISSTIPCLILHNLIVNKEIICNDKDTPWFNNQIERLIEKKPISLKAIWLMVDWL